MSRNEDVDLPTCIVSVNGSLHKGFHPLADNDLLVGTKIMRLVVLVHNPETVTAWINIFIGNDPIPNDIDVAFDSRLLSKPRQPGSLISCPQKN